MCLFIRCTFVHLSCHLFILEFRFLYMSHIKMLEELQVHHHYRKVATIHIIGSNCDIYAGVVFRGPTCPGRSARRQRQCCADAAHRETEREGGLVLARSRRTRHTNRTQAKRERERHRNMCIHIHLCICTCNHACTCKWLHHVAP